MALAVVAGGGWWLGARDAAASAQKAPEVSTRTVAASLTTVEKTVSASGTLTPSVQEEVAFLGSGTVLSVDVAVGDEVAPGQTLATIDTLQLNAELLQARADLAVAKAGLVASQDNDGSDAAKAQAAADAAKVEVAQSAAEAAEAAMTGATLTAPAAGRVTHVGIAVGDVVTGTSSSSGGATTGTLSATGSAVPAGATSSDGASTAAFAIVGDDQWQVEVSVGDADVALIAKGDQAEITLDDREGPIFGTVSQIELVSTSTSGVPAYPVTVAVTGTPDGLFDGVSADVEIVYERRTGVLTVPSAAVRTVDGESSVRQLDDDGDESTTPVMIGETVAESTEILSGLDVGDEVVLTVVQPATTGQQGFDTQPGFPPGFTPGQLPDGFDPSSLPQGGAAGGGGGRG